MKYAVCRQYIDRAAKCTFAAALGQEEVLGLDEHAPTCVEQQLRSYNRLMDLQDQVTGLKEERDALHKKYIAPNEHEYAILDSHNHVNFSFLDTLCDLVAMHNMPMRAAYPVALTVAQEVSLSMCGEHLSVVYFSRERFHTIEPLSPS